MFITITGIVIAAALMPVHSAVAYLITAKTPAFKLLYPEPSPNENDLIALDHFKGHSLLLAFWRSDCAPCIAERPALNAIAEAHPDMRIALVSLDGDAYKERHFPVPHASNMLVLVAAGNPEDTLKMLGDNHEALPFSLFMRSDGTVCDMHYGLLGTELADNWVKRC